MNSFAFNQWTRLLTCSQPFPWQGEGIERYFCNVGIWKQILKQL